MLVFPNPNDATEYTDPNGSVWQFNGTGWVRQPDCPDAGDGDASVEAAEIPTGYINLGATGYDNATNTDRTSTPICFGKDIYRVFNQPGATGPGYLRYSHWQIDEVGDAVQIGGLQMLEIPSSMTAEDVVKNGATPAPWNVRFKNYLFRSANQSYGDVYFKQNADKTISLGRLKDIGMDSWFWNSETFTNGCFVSSGGESLVFAFKRSNNAACGVGIIGVDDATGDLELLEKSDGTQPFGVRVAIAEAKYEGYDRPCIFYSSMTPSNTYVTYNYCTLTPDLQAISSVTSSNIRPDNNLIVTGDAFAARYRNNRGLAWISDVGDDFSSMAGPVVNADGTIPREGGIEPIAKEEDGKRFNYSIGGGVVSTQTNHQSVGCGAVGSTCGVYAQGGEVFNATNQYLPYTPSYFTADSYYYRVQNGIKYRTQTWQLQSSASAYGFAPCQRMHTVKAGENDQLYVSYGEGSDAYLYVWEDASVFIETGSTQRMEEKLERVSEQAAEFAAMESKQGGEE